MQLKVINQYLHSTPLKIRVLVFYVLACAWSWPFFWWRDVHSESWKALAIPNFLKTWSYMWGPGIAAVICFAIFGTKFRTITLKGTGLWRSILFYTTPICILSLITLNPQVLLFGVLGFISILGEELGWRGWLQDHLPINSDWKKAIAIGIMWELWHFTNRTTSGSFIQISIRVGIWICITTLLSFFALRLTARTRSLVAAVAIHASFDMCFEFEKAWIAILISIPLWAYLLMKWPRQEQVLIST